MAGLDLDQFVDDAGAQLCLKHAGVQRGRCRYGERCHRSHAPPSAASLPGLRIRAEARAAAQAAAAAHVANTARRRELPDWLGARRRQVVFDASGPPLERLRRACAAFLGVFEEGGLERLHVAEPDAGAVPLCPTLISAHKRAGRTLPRSWKDARQRQDKQLKKLRATPAWRAYVDAYVEFVGTVIAPLCGGGEGRVVAQCPPTLRIAMPANKATIGVHRDADYAGHDCAEINFWVPLTAVSGPRALRVESAPDLGDFRPVDLDVGQGLRFDGYNCRHYTVPNDSGETRVSFDFRVVPGSLWRGKTGGAKMGDYPVRSIGGD